MTRGCQNERRTAPRRFSASRERVMGQKSDGHGKSGLEPKGGGRKDGNGMDAPAVSHTHRSVQSLTHEGRKKKIPFLSLSLSRMHAWRGERANIRRINGQGEDWRWSCLCVQCTVLLRGWAGEGRQTRWQSGLMGNFGHLCKGGDQKGELCCCYVLLANEKRIRVLEQVELISSTFAIVAWNS